MALTGIFNSHLIMATLVQRFGTEEQKQQFLPRFATGELRGGLGPHRAQCRHGPCRAFAPVPTRMATTTSSMAARPGSPTGSRALAMPLLTKTDTQVTPAHKGMSFFIVEKGDGFSVSVALKNSATSRSTRRNWCSRTSKCRPSISSAASKDRVSIKRPAASRSVASTWLRGALVLRAPL